MITNYYRIANFFPLGHKMVNLKKTHILNFFKRIPFVIRSDFTGLSFWEKFEKHTNYLFQETESNP